MLTKRVVSVSLGSSSRDHRFETEILGQRVIVERIGTDGDVRRAKQLLEELDGKVDALGLGGTDLYLRAGNRQYLIRETAGLVRNVRRTPFVDGGGLKASWERWLITDYRWAEVVAGDFLLIRRFMPDDLRGKVIVTQTITKTDVEELRKRGVWLLVTDGPDMGGRSFATNVLQGVIVALLGRRPEEISPDEYLQTAQRAGFEPRVEELNPDAAPAWASRLRATAPTS